MYLIVGLGNPGKEYENTRHNIGFKAIDELAVRFNLTSLKSKHNSFIGEGKIGEHKVIIAEPQTFMNNSGSAVREILSWHKIEKDKLIVIYDDVDLEVGQVRIREKGSAGGHHGMESIISHIGTTEFKRIRIGIGRENLTGDVSNYVLQNIPSDQREKLALAANNAADAVQIIIVSGLAAAINKINA